jgi:hypothetical protein
MITPAITEAYRIAADLDHAAFRATFDCRIYHGDPVYSDPYGREPTARMAVEAYEPDPRCPQIVVWQISDGGAHRIPAVRRAGGFTLEYVRDVFGD